MFKRINLDYLVGIFQGQGFIVKEVKPPIRDDRIEQRLPVQEGYEPRQPTADNPPYQKP